VDLVIVLINQIGWKLRFSNFYVVGRHPWNSLLTLSQWDWCKYKWLLKMQSFIDYKTTAH